MSGDNDVFFGLVQTPLVRHGEDAKLPKGDHTFIPVYTEMLLQVCFGYPGLPDIRTLTIQEIRFFYEGLRASLKKETAPSRR